jgi:hypothetical protein
MSSFPREQLDIVRILIVQHGLEARVTGSVLSSVMAAIRYCRIGGAMTLIRLSLLSVLGLAAAVLSSGCAKYEYDLVQPPELARHVGDTWTVATIDPLEYRLRTYENHLIVQVWNHSTEPIQLLGDRSVVVDPKGQSHPLRSQAIAPNSYLKLILPPAPTEVYRSGPTFGIGVGVGVGHFHGHDWHGGYPYYGGFYDPFWYDEPRYIAVYDNNESAYWEWDGDAGVARMVLVFGQGDKTFTHELAFRRKKM